MKITEPWHEEAHRLREKGVSFRTIADQVGVDRGKVFRYCKSIFVEGQAQPAWYAEARRIRASEKIACRDIAKRLGVSKTRVTEVCRDIEIGDLRNKFQPGRKLTPEQMQRSIETRRRRKLENETYGLAKLPFDPSIPKREPTRYEIRRAMVRRRLAGSSRVPPPITLPTLSCLRNPI